MTLFVLDTDILTLFQLGHATVRRNVAAHAIHVSTSVISVEEQLTGWYSVVRQAKQVDKLARAYHQLAVNVASLAFLKVLNFDVPSIQRYESLRKAKLNVRKNDLRIAAIVLEVGATLVTRNAHDFQRVPGLIFVDWSQ